MIASRPAWQTAAACKNQLDVFYPVMNEDKDRLDVSLYEPAKKICAACPVQEVCLEDALTNNERHGVWGGLAPAERRHLRARRTSDQRSGQMSLS